MEENEKLKKENEKLKKEEENKSNLIFITTHQLRTSLSALKWILKILVDEEAGKLTNEQNELIQKAYNSNEHMLSLVNNLLIQNKTSESEINYNFKKIDLIKTIEQTIFEFSGEVKQNNIDLILLKPEKILPPIICDEEMIKVVLQNLIENSIKYSKKGGKVFISVVKKNNTIQTSIKDSGIGININDKKNIFKKFFRAPNAQKKDITGSGLGLYTTKNIINNHRGEIWFEESNNGGTTFFFTLPIS
jgi:signal transduction histidine kinase